MKQEKKLVEIHSPGGASSVYVLVWALVFDKSCFFYLFDADHPISNSDAPSFDSLAVAMNGIEGPISSQLMSASSDAHSSNSDDFAASFARRITLRFNIQVFISSQITVMKDPNQLFQLETQLVAFIKENFPLDR
jgi:hypothetical protein